MDIWTGDTLEIHRVRREDMGAYLCIASNDVPPTVSKRIYLHVQCEDGFSNYPQNTASVLQVHLKSALSLLEEISILNYALGPHFDVDGHI